MNESTPAHRSTEPIRRNYVAAEHGLVHYRVAGSGPPVVLLHDSPRSSLLHIPLINALAERFTVFAPDTPGYGRSDPLAPEPRPEIADFARALHGTLAALGLERPVVYAYHTSSKIALECAVRYPQSIGFLVIDGIAVPEETASEAFISRYMAPFRPDSDGSYLAAQWTKLRDMHRFFPWFEKDAGRRLPMDEPDAPDLHAYALDCFMAGPDYASAYGAAMRYAARPALKQLEVPTAFIARADDVLFPFLDVVEAECPASASVERLTADREAWRSRLVELFSEGSKHSRIRADAVMRADTGARHYVAAGDGQAHVLVRGREGPGVLLLAELPGGARGAEASIDYLARTHRVVAPDLPGLGGSDALSRAAEFRDWLTWLVDAAEPILGDRFHVAGHGLSGVFALGLAAGFPDRVGKVALDGIPVPEASARDSLRAGYAPTMELTSDGTHFLSMFHRIRDAEIQWPWFDKRASQARKIQPDLDPHRLYTRLVDSLICPDHYGDACHVALSEDPRELASRAEAPLLVLDVPGDPAYAGAQTLAAAAPRGLCREGGPTRRSRDEAIGGFLEA